MRIAVLTLIVLLLCLIPDISSSSTKTERTYYTAERLEAMRANLEKYEWAKNKRDSIVSEANKWVDIPDEELRMMVPPPQLPRAAYVNETGCPVHGLEIRKHGTYAWKVASEHPFKVQCPVGGEFYPDNDFDAYYRSCWVDGEYNPDKGDRSLLKGEIIDDGWGWDKPDDDSEQKYWFVAYYTHWYLANKVVTGVLRDCAQAYLLTGDERYAHKTALVLWQLAHYYPDYAYEKQSRRGTEFNPHYWGKLKYHTWECYTVTSAAKAYDAVFPYLEKDVALQELTGQNAGEIGEYIESRMLRDMARLIFSRTIQGNYGMHQSGLLLVALVCGDEENEPKRSEMIDWVLNNDDVERYTDLSLNDALYNVIYRDGVPFESPGYNWSWIRNLLVIAQMLEECGVEVLSWPRFRGLFDWLIDMRIAGNFTPALGDSGHMYHRPVGRNRTVYGPAFAKWGDPRYAVISLEGGSYYDLFTETADEAMERAAAEYDAVLGTESFLFPGYGMSILQTGNEQNRTALMLYQGAYRWAHAHFDAMHIDFYSRGFALMPDFGYPETANSNDPRRFGFFSHSLAHNLVMIDETRSARAAGHVTAFDPTPFCQIVDAHCEELYPRLAGQYRRTLGLVDVTGSDAYLVDIVRVAGGQQHDWVVHGHEGTYESNLALTPPRAEGTLAGPDVEYGYFYDNEEMAKAPYGTISYISYTGSAFMYLFNVQEGVLDGCDTFSFIPTRRPPGTPTGKIVNRAHLIGDDERIFVCDGKPQQNVKVHPETVKFLLRRRGDKHNPADQELQSTFITVFEPYVDEPFLNFVQRLTTQPQDPTMVALKIQKADGGIDYFLSATDPEQVYRVEGGIVFEGETGAISTDAEGRVTHGRLTNGSQLQMKELNLAAQPVQRVKIAELNYETGTVVLARPALTDETLVGRWVTISNDLHSTMYRVEKLIDEKTFSIGDQDPRCGRLLPSSWDDNTHTLATSNYSEAVRPGMYIADEENRILGQITAGRADSLVLGTGPSFELDNLPDKDRDGKRRVWAMDFAVGDEVKLCNSLSYEAP